MHTGEDVWSHTGEDEMDSTATATPSHQNIVDAPQEHGRSSVHPKNMAAPLKTINPGIAGD
jgi:hypothetical protein